VNNQLEKCEYDVTVTTVNLNMQRAAQLAVGVIILKSSITGVHVNVNVVF
jgi:hypothetical protein